MPAAAKHLIAPCLFALVACFAVVLVPAALGSMDAPAAAAENQPSRPEWFPLVGSWVIGCTNGNPPGISSYCSSAGYHGYWALDIASAPSNSAFGGSVHAAGSGWASVESYDGVCSSSGGYGTSIVIDHGQYGASRYAHLSAASLPADGDGDGLVWVERGDKIGEVGNTGRSTCDWPHLHFERLNASGVRIDPVPLKACHGSNTASYPQAFNASWTSWSQVTAFDSWVVNDGYACAGGGATAGGECNGLAATVNMATGVGSPTSGADVIVGTEGDDDIDGLGGADVICGLGGRDAISGGLGDDTIFGGAGIDRISGNGGNDILHGDGGSDRLRGGTGSDIIRAGSGADRVWGGSGPDDINGMGGQDTIWGEAGEDVIQGSHQSDLLYGGSKADTVRGAGGKDRIYGGGGNDALYGGDNTDYLNGGSGVDYGNGQAGNDKLSAPGASGCVDVETAVSC